MTEIDTRSSEEQSGGAVASERGWVGRAIRSEVWIGRVLLVISAAVLLVFWHLYASTRSPLILPKPYDVLERLITYVESGRAWPHVWLTTQEIFLGFLLGSLMGIGIGTLASQFGIFRRVIMPYVIITQALPKFALAPILVLWFGFGMQPKIIIAALIAFFPLLENTYLGLTSTPNEMLELSRAIRMSRFTTLMKVRVPHAVPTIFSGLRVALMLSLVGAVVAEYIGGDKGLGALILVARGTFDTELMFVAFVLLTALGFALDKLHSVSYRLVLRRMYGRAAAKAGAATGGFSV